MIESMTGLHSYSILPKLIHTLLSPYTGSAPLNTENAPLLQSSWSEQPTSILRFYEQTKEFGFWLHGSQVDVLYAPKEFYARLKGGFGDCGVGCTLTNLSSSKPFALTPPVHFTPPMQGHDEKDLVNTLRQALVQTPTLQVTILMDYLRATRGAPLSSIHALEALKLEFRDRISIKLYHTPDLSGWKKTWIPPRYNETIGLLHFKLYITDDRVLISGANLNRDYFVSRQDRYLQIGDAGVSDHYARVAATVGTFSFDVAGTRLVPPDPCPVRSPAHFRMVAHQRLAHVLAPHRRPEPRRLVPPDTLLVPGIQAAPLRIQQEHTLMQAFWRGIETLPAHPTLWFTSGYFNVTPAMLRVLVAGPFQGPLHVLTASPNANSFFQSQGLSKWVPHAYTYLEERFLREVQRAQQQYRVDLREYHREHTGPQRWTYHAKGIWAAARGASEPCATAVGSSNFGPRSLRRDLEAQALVFTENKELRNRLYREVQQLWMHSLPMDACALRARNVHWLTKVTASLVKTMF